MTQECKIHVQFTMEVDAEYSKQEIERRINLMLENSKSYFEFPDMDLVRTDVIQIEEEAEIYGNE